MRRLFLLLSFILFVYSCTYGPYITTLGDEFSDSHEIAVLNNYVDILNQTDVLEQVLVGTGNKHLKVNCTYNPDKNSDEITLVVEYWGSDWIFIRGGESLILIIDGEKINLSGTGSDNFRDIGKDGSNVKEFSFYQISKDLFKKITYANEVKLKVIGDKGNILAKFNENNFNIYKNFYTTYIEIQN